MASIRFYLYILLNIFYSLDITVLSHFPFALSPLLLNFYAAFRTRIQPINKSRVILLHLYVTTGFQTVTYPPLDYYKIHLIGPLSPFTTQQPQWSFQNRKNMSLSLKTFNGFTVFYCALQESVCSGPHLLHCAYAFSLPSIFVHYMWKALLHSEPFYLPFCLPPWNG